MAKITNKELKNAKEFGSIARMNRLNRIPWEDNNLIVLMEKFATDAETLGQIIAAWFTGYDNMDKEYQNYDNENKR